MSTPGDRSRWPVDPSTLEAVSALRIRVRRVVEGLPGGAHPSPHRGSSVEFAEHKKYSPGDDIRHVDWKALARTDRYFVKQHQREVTLRCLMLLDCSASMGYRGSRAHEGKLASAVVLLAAMAHILVRQGDAAGFLTFSSGPGTFVPARHRPDHLASLMTRLAGIEASAAPGTSYAEVIRRAADAAGRRAMIVLASDLWSAGREVEVALGRLAARGHDVVVFHVLDPDEIDLPFKEPSVFAGLEGEGEVEVDPAVIRGEYRRRVGEVRERWRRVCSEAGIDLVPAPTDVPVERVLHDFAARRRRLVRPR
ncbi:MAG: DUF58 domain-containing protein [Deltaproteobacteria bacterium]|nr:DUF58 domain-containing protein [Deltaproteobacteria bacterium]